MIVLLLCVVNDLEVEANADGDDGVGFKGEIIAVGVLFNKLRFEELVNCRSCCLLLLRVENVPRLLIVCKGVNLPDIVSWSSALTLDFLLPIKFDSCNGGTSPSLQLLSLPSPLCGNWLPLPLFASGGFSQPDVIESFFSTIVFDVDVVSRSSASAATSMPALAFASSPVYVSATFSL